MIVVDTNVIAYLLMRNDDHVEAVDNLLLAHPEWIAPRLWEDEFVNLLATCERRKLLSPAQAATLLADAATLMEGASYDVAPLRSLAVTRRIGCTGYDSQFIALAEDLGVPLYTFDEQILAQAGDLARIPN